MAKFEDLPGPRGLQLGQPSELSTARRKLWCDVWVAMALSTTCDRPDIARDWADAAVKDFDERFNLISEEQARRAAEQLAGLNK